MKRIYGLAIAAVMMGAMAFAQETAIRVSGFGRHGIKAAGEREALYGADIDVYFSVWRVRQFNWWVGIGGGWAPEQEFVSDSSVTSYGGFEELLVTSMDVCRARDLKMQYGELRLVTVPEWNATDWLSVGLRLGVAFDFVNISGRNFESRTTRWEPYLELPNNTDIIRNASYDTDELAVAGIVGFQVSVMPWEDFGFYGSVDARLGGDVDIGGGEKVKMNSVQWNAGLIFQF